MSGKHEADAEETILVDRAPAEDTATGDRGLDEETGERELEAETIVVERPLPEEEDAETIVVARDLPEEDAATIVVERADPDSTVIVERSGPVDGTVALTRERAKSPAGPALPGGRRRRGMSMPPVAPGYGRGAVEAVGPGAVTTYVPRDITPPPAVPEAFVGVEATRAEAPSMPSVLRRARRSGAVSLAAFGLACVVSVAGLIALGVAVFG